MYLLAGNAANGAAGGSASANAIVPTLILLAIVALLIGVIAVVRRTMFKNEDTTTDPMAGFSLGSLRQLVKDGKMTPEEYEKAKAKLVEAAQRKIDEKAEPVDAERLAAEQKPRAE